VAPVLGLLRLKHPPRVFGHSSLPQRRRGSRIGGNVSYQPPETLQDPGKTAQANISEADMLSEQLVTHPHHPYASR